MVTPTAPTATQTTTTRAAMQAAPVRRGSSDLGHPLGSVPDAPVADGSTALAEPSATASGGSRPDPPNHRRGARWFELNPGCFARAALWSGCAAVGSAVLGALGAWAAWRFVRRLRVVRTTRAMWRGYRRVRRFLGRRAGRGASDRSGVRLRR
ncbi:MAG: hypothetical protein ACRDWE_09425 [Acidimicrobiales bacterium]